MSELSLFGTLSDLEDRRIKLLAQVDGEAAGSSSSEVELPTSAADSFAALVLTILKEWHFPDADRVHFDLRDRDLVLNGKKRVSYGKGLRAVTQAAFTVGLLEYCRQNGRTHPGFIILDSPLLSYREPDNAEDDLSSSDLNAHFYHYLSTRMDDRQFIIVENTDPPADVQASEQAIKFTGTAVSGRYGYFPSDASH
jgi:hypothetical protein